MIIRIVFVTTTDVANITVTNQYDAAGNLTSVTDGKGQRTEFQFDGLGRNTVTRHPDLNEKTLIYNALVQTRRVDESGRITDYAYDVRNRLKEVDYDANETADRVYSYDAAGNLLTVDEDGTLADVAYTYDNLNRVLTETSVGVTHQYTYDLAGNRIHTHIGDGQGGVMKTLFSTYDALNRTATILEDENGNGLADVGERLTAYQYDLAGGIRIQTQPNGHAVVKKLDALGRAHTILGPDGADNHPLYVYTHGFDLYGNLAHIQESYPSAHAQLDARTLVNLYDPANRLLTETVQTGGETVTTTYAYDHAHNRTAKTVTHDDGEDVTVLEQAMYTFTNALNQISVYHDSVSGKTVGFTYDLNGNRVQRAADTTGDSVADEITVYTYDAENRLLAHEKTAGGGADLHHYAYDYRTRRVLRDESGAGGDRTLLVFSGGLSVQEWTVAPAATQPDPATDTLEVLYVRGSDYGGGIGGVLYTLRDLNEDGQLNNAAFNHYNSRGDVVARMDDGGALMYQAAYEAFGRHGDTPGTQEWGGTADRQQANTKDEDPTGLLNEGFRYRDLETGTFITRDPLGFVDGPNVYTYVVQNPWTFFDPHGLSRKDAEGFTWKGEGHHKVPVSQAQGWSNEAKEVFDKATIDTHGHDFSAHGKYNDEVGAEMADFLSEKGLKSPGDVSAKRQRELAEEFVDRIDNTGNKYVKGFNRNARKGKEAVRSWYNKKGKNIVLNSTGEVAGKTGARKIKGVLGGKAARKLGLVAGVAFFASDVIAGGGDGDGFVYASGQFIKSATFYDITIEPIGNAYNNLHDNLSKNVRDGTFNENTGNPVSDQLGRGLNQRAELQKLLEEGGL